MYHNPLTITCSPNITDCVRTNHIHTKATAQAPQPLLVTGLGVGVHLTFCKSRSLLLPSQPASRPIASARLEAAVPMVRSSSLFAAGVKDPGASDLRGVHDGGGMDVLRPLLPDERDNRGTPLSKPAFTRRLLEASLDSL